MDTPSVLDASVQAGGMLVPHSYSPGFIVLSYFVCVNGCWTSLELLNKRTSSRGWYNWYLLFAAATTMGAVAIWCMHFIGNRAINMLSGAEQQQIAYSPGFTAGSFFLPIAVVGLAFYTLTTSGSTTSWIRIVLSGFICGCAICGMHYLGQMGISNYENVFDWRYVLGAAIIAVVAASTALGVFFHFKAEWTNVVWKRILCAMLLAAAVSGMHWVATVGTTYRIRSGQNLMVQGLSRTQTVAVVGALSVLACVGLISIAILGQRRRKASLQRAQQVVLACATFDSEGKILVTPELTLPAKKITNSYIEETLDETFSVDHPVFHWLFRASRNWMGVIDLIPGMRMHIRHRQSVDRPNLGNVHFGIVENYATIFKELFCIAAQDLASMVDERLEDLGVLYDKIFETGTVRHGHLNVFKHHHLPNSGTDSSMGDAECGSKVVFGRGQVLFVVRRVEKQQAASLSASGFHFVPLNNALETLARSMEVTTTELRPALEDLRNYPMVPAMLQPGYHVAAFVVRPLYHRGFDVLVNNAAPNLLPSQPLAIENLQDEDIATISSFANLELEVIYERLQYHLAPNLPGRFLMEGILRSVRELEKIVGPELLKSSRLCPRIYDSPCRPDRDPTTGQQLSAKLIVFRFLADVHQTQRYDGLTTFTPTALLINQQYIYPNRPDHGIFARRAHIEFAQLKHAATNESRTTRTGSSPKSALKRPNSPRSSMWHARFGSSRSKMTLKVFDSQGRLSRGGRRGNIETDTSSEKNLVHNQTTHAGSNNHLGGIHVSNELTIDIREVGSSPDDRGIREYSTSTLAADCTDRDDNNASENSNDKPLGSHAAVVDKYRPKKMDMIEMSPLGMTSMGTRTEAMRAGAPMEAETFIDELMLLILSERREGRWAK